MDNLIFHTAFVGDLLLTIPFINEVRRRWRDDRVTLVCRPGLKKLFLNNKIVNDVIELKKGDSASEDAFKARARELNIRNIYCPHQSFRSAWLLRNVKAEKKVAYKTWWNHFFFNHRVERPMKLPEVLRLMALLEPVKILDQNNLESLNSVDKWPATIDSKYSMAVRPEPQIVAELLARLKVSQPFVALAPGSQWLTKRWTTEGFAEVATQLRAQGLNIYLVGSEKESGTCEEVLNLCGGGSPGSEVRSLAGQTDLYELHALLSAGEFVVANDSGSAHMAVAAGRPVVAIFGPTVLAQGYRPWSDQSAVAQIALPCRPCGRHGHMKCPIGTHDCMKKISADQVLHLAQGFKAR